MQRRFLGDAKDSFKWDYHDYLASELGYDRLTVAYMMLLDGTNNTHGRRKPEEFPARQCVIELCHALRDSRDPMQIDELPKATGATYRVDLHRGETLLTKDNRAGYFAGFDGDRDQLVFLDPDNGFEPKTCTPQHVCYEDVARVLGQVTEGSVVSVFQHFRRVTFPDDFAGIRKRLDGCHSTAIYWRELMFVAVARTHETIERIRVANRAYAQGKPVKVIA